jgi:uncharacterized protein (DUF1501 family)
MRTDAMNDAWILQTAVRGSGSVSRRGFLRGTLGAAAAAGTIGWMDRVIASADELRRQGRACILLWMQGGPSQLETFDPKPGTDNGGPTQAIETSVPGIRIAQSWPKLAAVCDQLALVRSMNNREGNHQRATYQLHTGYVPGGALKHPHFGSIAARELGGNSGDLPDFVSVGRTLGAGFLGVEYDPFVVNNAQRPPADTELPVPSERFTRRLKLLGGLEAEFASGAKQAVQNHRSIYDRATRLVLSPQLRAFDLSQEPGAVRDAYGRTVFGQGCLLARRLIEGGVTFVEVRSGGWDTHQENFERTGNLAAQVDPAFAQLIADLKERGMLEKTLVIWMGEFGRTPKINQRNGRDHFPRAFNVVAAGGGIRGGQFIGATSEDSMQVADRPVTVADLFCSFCYSLQIDPRKETVSPIGRPMKVVDGGTVVEELFG